MDGEEGEDRYFHLRTVPFNPLLKFWVTDGRSPFPVLGFSLSLLTSFFHTRTKILLPLSYGELCVCDIAHTLGLSLSATSHPDFDTSLF